MRLNGWAAAGLAAGGIAVSMVGSSVTEVIRGDRPLAPAPIPEAVDSVAGWIAPARNSQCAEIGPRVARYLVTGNNEGRPELDAHLAETYNHVKSAPSQARDGLIRVAANQATTNCDQRADDLAAAAEQQRIVSGQARVEAEQVQHEGAERARREAEQAQASQAARARLESVQRGSCLNIGGRFHQDAGRAMCYSTVTGNPSGNPGAECDPHGQPLWIGFQPNGLINPAAYRTSQDFYPKCFR